MNKKFKELAVQAFFDEATTRPSDKMYTFSDHKMAKFAELIVQECAEHIRNRAMRAGGACTIVGEESLWLAKDLEEHFGVEE